MNLRKKEELAGASAAIGIFIIILGVALLSGCAAGVNLNSGRTEIPRRPEAVQNRPLSSLLVVQPYRSTWAIVRIYEGNLSRNQAIGNVGGKLAFYDDYIHKIELTNAFVENMPNAGGRDVANTAVLVLESCKNYTIVSYIGRGRGWFEKVYDINVINIRTGTDPVASSWTDRWGRRWMANQVIVLPGTNESSSASWNFHYQVNATELMRNAVGSALAR